MNNDKVLVRETPLCEQDDAAFLRHLRNGGFTPCVEERRWRRRFFWLLSLASILVLGLFLEVFSLR